MVELNNVAINRFSASTLNRVQGQGADAENLFLAMLLDAPYYFITKPIDIYIFKLIS